MAETDRWAWHVTSPWPGFDPARQHNLVSRGTGLSLDPASLRPIRWRSVVGGAPAAMPSPPLRVTLGSTAHHIVEAAAFSGGTLVAAGTAYPVQVNLWLLDDGTCLLRLRDSHLPRSLLMTPLTALTLGTPDPAAHAPVTAEDDTTLCFVAGTMIHTVDGLVPVEDLLPGDLVLTADHGFRPLQWSARRSVAGYGSAAPVLIEEGTLGNSRDLRVSQHHRIMLSDWRANLLFGATEVLAAARDLVNGHSIRITPCQRVDYVYLLFDQHELVFSEGILTESVHPGDDRLFRLSQNATPPAMARGPHHTARPCLRRWEVQTLRPPPVNGR